MTSSITCGRINRLLFCTKNTFRTINVRNKRRISTTIFDFVENGKLVEIPLENIRNFSVIAHVDHGICYLIIFFHYVKLTIH